MTEQYFDFKNFNTDKLTQYKDEIIATMQFTLDTISLPNSNRTFQNTVQPIITTKTLLEAKIHSFSYASNFYPDKNMRDLATELAAELDDFYIKCALRKDAYNAFKQYYQSNYEAEKQTLTLEENKYVGDTKRDYRRSGMELPDDQLNNLKEMLSQISNAGILFESNINEDNTSFQFTKDQLLGLPDYWFSDSKLISPNVYKVTLKYPDYNPIMEYVHDESIRKQLYVAYSSRCSDENTPLLETTVKLRYKIAKLLGYDTFADYVTEVNIVKNAKTALDFENRMNDHLTQPYLQFMNNLVEFSKSYKLYPLTKKELDHWDMSYYNRLYQEYTCDYDREQVRQYFPFDVVKKGMFEIYQILLGLKFTLVPTDNIWHEEVDMYCVHDAKSDELLGYFYLDMHPREGKFSHAAVFDFQASCDMSKITGENKRKPAIVAMACNFPKGECIPFDDLVTLFHEFGHCTHQICSKSQLAEYHGFGVEKDFIECPSQFCENMAYYPETLQMMSSNEKTGEKISLDLIEKLNKSKKISGSYDYKTQLMYGIFDLKLHTLKFNNSNEKINLRKIWYDTVKEVMEVEPTEQFDRYASFGHLYGYEAGYFGYLLSLTYSTHMFYKKFKYSGILNEIAGMEYRKKILEPGSTKDGMDLLKKFLGEEPDEKYFLIDNGLI